jgi:hypothetical protein
MRECIKNNYNLKPISSFYSLNFVSNFENSLNDKLNLSVKMVIIIKKYQLLVY